MNYTTTITADQLEVEIRRLATENPNNIYNANCNVIRCWYSKGECSDGSVGCIFGQAFKNLGCEIHGDSAIGDVLNSLKIYCTSYQREWFVCLQITQDAKKTWGEALRNANAKIAMTPNKVAQSVVF